jgi:putative oxidoreductase
MAAHAIPLDTTADLGRLVLRASLGILILLHGIAKAATGPGAVMGLLAKSGLPTGLGYLVYVGEIAAPVFLILGLWTRPAALVVAINMAFAIFLAHRAEVWSLTKSGGWAIELQGIYLFAALAIALLGAGRYSLGGRHGRWN